MKSLLLLAVILCSALANPEISPKHIYEVFQGVIDGLNQHSNLEHTKDCLVEVPVFIKAIKTILKKFKKINWSDINEIIKIVMEIYEAGKKFWEENSCKAVPEEWKNMISEIDFGGIINRIIENYKLFIEKFKAFLKNLKEKSYKLAGREIGEIIYAVLFIQLDEDAAQDFVRGFLRGVGITEAIENIMKCYKNLLPAVNRIKQFIQMLKDLSASRYQQILSALGQIFGALKEIMELLLPCGKAVHFFMKVISAIRNINISNLAWNLIKNAPSFIGDIMSAINGFSGGNYYQAGNAIGDMTAKLLFGRLLDPVKDFPELSQGN